MEWNEVKLGRAVRFDTEIDGLQIEIAPGLNKADDDPDALYVPTFSIFFRTSESPTAAKPKKTTRGFLIRFIYRDIPLFEHALDTMDAARLIGAMTAGGADAFLKTVAAPKES